MPIIVQHAGAPGEVLRALTALAYPAPERVRIAVAYATLSGCRLLFGQLGRLTGAAAWEAIPKELVVSLDYGVTEPRALQYLMQAPGCTVSVSSPGVVARPRFQPEMAYHPKVYQFERGLLAGMLVGSANLTQAALTTNTEAVQQDPAVPRADAAAIWQALAQNAVPLTDVLLAQYAVARRREGMRFRPDGGRRAPPAQNAGALPVFRDAVSSGALVPSQWSCLWVQTRARVEGGAANQVEIPRLGSYFFGFNFNNHATRQTVQIGPLAVAVGNTVWRDRQIAWHGGNQMERAHLPTGFSYENSAVLFRRRAGMYEIEVAPWRGAAAAAWMNASAGQQRIYRLGRNTDRLCGVF